MKLLFVIPHYYKPKGTGHGSLSAQPKRRIIALSEAILALHQHFGTRQCEINLHHRVTLEANTLQRHHLDVILCTTGTSHLLEQLPIPKNLFYHCPTPAEPLLLGYECHRVLQDALGKYDYYCFLEDDLVIHDASFFQKLDHFNDVHGHDNLLQPNRYELSPAAPYLKAYVDGEMRPRATEPFQNTLDNPELSLDYPGYLVTLKRTLNPHSGCFFLTQDQMRFWSQQPYFLDRSTAFIGPLESAATLGIMKAFKIYKPAREYASFLEIKHADSRFIGLIGSVVKTAEDKQTAIPNL